MKNLILLCICVFSLNTCNAQNKRQKNTQKKTTLKYKKMNPHQYLITKDSEKFVSQSTGQVKLSNGNFMQITCGNYGCYSEEFLKNTYYKVCKEFYPNGNIKSKGISFNQGTFRVGIWYEFNENGKFTKEINYDEGYDFALEDVIKYAESQKDFRRYEEQDDLVFAKGEYVSLNQGQHNTIKKETLNNQKLWILECNISDKEKSLIENGKITGRIYILTFTQIILDGKTGKVLYKKEIGEEEDNSEAYKKVIAPQKLTSFLVNPNEKGTHKKLELGVAYNYGEPIPKNTFQVYDGRAYTKSEWEEFRKTLPWWKRLM